MNKHSARPKIWSVEMPNAPYLNRSKPYKTKKIRKSIIMWKSIKNQKYLEIVKYSILGIILGVLIFQFVTNSIRNHKLDFNSLFVNETLKYIISTIVGAFVGGFIFLLMTINNKDREIRENKLWLEIKGNKRLFYIKNILAFSIGGFTYKVLGNLFDIINFKNVIQTLFSTDYIIDYFAFILAMVVFSIFISIGIEKRLNLLFE